MLRELKHDVLQQRSVVSMVVWLLVPCSLCLFVSVNPCTAQDEVAMATEAAIKFASRSVVQIDSIGGLTPKGKSKSTASFSGTVVSSDGLIVTASYNLLHDPATVFVRLPSKDGEVQRFAAEISATDSSRNLTLLKIKANGLTPIQFVGDDEFRVGQRVIAIGKCVSPVEPNVSFGIVSAKRRIWSRATQTDAKISRLNYGGPLVTLSGEAIGILVPMSHTSSDVGAGDGWYDSGIGFAANVDSNSGAFKQFLEGVSIRPGLAGITFEGADENADPAKIAFCLPASPAGKAGLKVGDEIVEANGIEIVRQGQFKHAIGPLYEDELLNVKVVRAGERIDFSVVLDGEIDPYVEPELGILLQLNKEKPVVEFVLPDSPARNSGLKIGDQITKVNETEVVSCTRLRKALRQLIVDTSCEVEVLRDDKRLRFSLKPRRQIAKPLGVSLERSEGKQQACETIEIAVAEASNTCFAFVPKTDDAVEVEAEKAEDKDK